MNTVAVDTRCFPTPARSGSPAGVITRMPIYRRGMLGLAQSFQITTLLLDFSVIDNVALAVQACAGHSFRFWHNVRCDPALREPALAALARFGLADRAGMLTSRLSHGEHRQMEIAIALAAGRTCCCSASRWPGSVQRSRTEW